MGEEKPYNPLSDYLKRRFNGRVFKVTVNAGLTCPNRDGTTGLGGCIYCEPATLVPQNYRAGMSVSEQLKSGIERVRKRHGACKFIAYFQINTNTNAPVEHLRRLYTEALRCPDVVGLAVSTRPDCVDEEVVGLFSELKEEKDLWLELGLQSAKEQTLELIKRGHTVDDFSRAAALSMERGLKVCAHVILGLPGEDKTDMLSTMRFLSEQKVWGVKFHQLQVIRGTPLEEMYKQGQVRLLDLEQYAGLVVECLEHLRPETVIHRLAGDTPKEFLVAPLWGANKFIVIDRIMKLLEERKTRQGAEFLKEKVSLP